MENVEEFKYLGSMLDRHDTDEREKKFNMGKATSVWAKIRKVLAREKSNEKVMGQFFREIVMTVLLHGAESWTLTSKQTNILEVWQHKIARHITHRHIHPDPMAPDGWQIPDRKETLEKAGCEAIVEVIRRKRMAVKKYMETESDQYQRGVQLNVLPNKYWWNQSEAMDIEQIEMTERRSRGQERRSRASRTSQRTTRSMSAAATTIATETATASMARGLSSTSKEVDV